jgi:superfamily II DNA or RNA helicase
MSSTAEPSGHASNEQAVGRAEAYRWATEEVHRLSNVVSSAEDILSWYRSEVRSARVKQKKARIQSRLTDLSVRELARRGDKIRWRALTENGIRTAQDVLNQGYEALREINGIGENSASQLISLAHQAAQVQSSDLRPPKDTKKWIAADVDLARALQVFASAAQLIGLPHLAGLQQLIVALKFLKQATNWLRWMFGGSAKKSVARTQYGNLRSESGSTRTSHALDQIKQGISQARQLSERPESRDEVIARWGKSTADMYALLERFVADGGDSQEVAAISHGLVPHGLSSTLRNRIDGVVLDKALVARNLRVYQEFAAKFALAVGRGLLGDDMGLGKTIEALAAIAHAITKDRQNHHVVVCPAALIDNWLREIKETLPRVNGWAYRNEDRRSAMMNWRREGGILLTSYEQAKHLLDDNLPRIGFIVADEAHYVKNSSAKRTNITKELVKRADRALLMGGTLLENRAEDLISLAGVVDPIQELRMRDRFGDGRDAHHEPDEFRRQLGEFYLRRNQDEVLTELPEIMYTDEPITVGESEYLAYKEAISRRNLARARIALSAGNDVASQKMAALSQIVEDCRIEGRKVLIFTEFRPVLDTVAELIGGGCLVIHGDISQSKRPAITETFQESRGFAALAMQIRVGGIGLNLQAASVVVLVEPQYKPSTEWQAIARAQRMGQSQCVMVYRLVAKESIEERIVALTDFKTELFDKLAKHSELADSSFDALDNRVDPAKLLADERRRLGLDNEDGDEGGQRNGS